MFEMRTFVMNVENENREARAIFIFFQVSFHNRHLNSVLVYMSRRHHTIRMNVPNCANFVACRKIGALSTPRNRAKSEKSPTHFSYCIYLFFVAAAAAAAAVYVI